MIDKKYDSLGLSKIIIQTEDPKMEIDGYFIADEIDVAISASLAVDTNYHKYDIRHSDDGADPFCTIEPFVGVNKLGSVYTATEIKFPNEEDKFINIERAIVMTPDNNKEI